MTDNIGALIAIGFTGTLLGLTKDAVVKGNEALQYLKDQGLVIVPRNQWQPISLAPKGIPVYLHSKYWDEPEIGIYKDEVSFDKGGQEQHWWHYYDKHALTCPEIFCYLPEPPEDGS